MASHPQPVLTPMGVTREASPSASARIRALKERLHEAHQAVQLANDMEAIRAACRSVGFINTSLYSAAQETEDETRAAAERELAAAHRARLERLSA